MKKTIQNISTSPTYLIVVYFFVTAIIGGFNYYSPVPVQDYWDQSILFFHDINNGNYSAWFDFHNEHRIAIVRVFYFIIHFFFPDHEYFLTLLNYLFFMTLYLFLYCVGKINNKIFSGNHPDLKKLYFVIFFSMAFFWSQRLNYFFEVQSQVILSFLLPLVGFYYLNKYYKSKLLANFILCIFFGIISSYTIISGVIVLPIMMFFVILMEKGLTKNLLILLFFSILSSLVYFSGYDNQNHSSILNNLYIYDLSIIDFYLSVIGSPISFLFGKSYFAQLVAKFFGLFVLVVFIRKIFVIFKTNTLTEINFTIFLFSIYLFSTLFLTSLGRVDFGLQEAYSSRYTTCSLLLYCSLLSFFSEDICSIYKKKKKIISVIVYIVILLMAIYQTTAFKRFDEKFNKRNIAILALHLKIDDAEYLEKLYPDTERLKDIYEKARIDNISISRKFNKLIKTNIFNEDYQLLNLEINSSKFFSVDDKYFRFTTKVFADNGFYNILDESKNIIGYGFVSENKKFMGYINNNKFDKDVFIGKIEY